MHQLKTLIIGRYLLILVGLLMAISAFGQFRQTPFYRSKPSYAALLLPGGTHFQEGNFGKGLFFATAETGLFASALIFNDELKANNESEYYNYPFILGQQLYVVDKGDFYLRELKGMMQQTDEFAYTIPSFRDMVLAPFQPKVLKEPLVWGLAGAAVLENVLVYALADNIRTFKQVRKVHGYGRSFNPGWGSTAYGATGSMISWGAGVSEEMMFRGYLQPILHYRFGANVGLWGTSLLFSAAHIPSYLKIKDPLQLAWAVSQITAVGYLFGLNAQNNQYDIQTVIAAHTWYDIAIMATSWMLDPKNNPLGFRVTFSID